MLTDKSLLWSLRHASGIQSYLFGTMHVQDARIYSKSGAIIPLIASSDVYAAEMDLDAASEFMTHSEENEKEVLSESYTDHQWNRIVKSTRKHFSMDISSFRHLPSFQLLQLITLSYMGKENVWSLDQFLWNQAKSQGKQMEGLETIEEQFGLLHKVSSAGPAQDLKSISRNYSRLKSQIKSLIQNYLDEDLTGLYHQSRKSLGAARKWMVNHRNPIMAERLDVLASHSSVFAAVGAAHIPGRFGLLRLMKHRGYLVQAIKASDF